jgi:hypothetical protein
MSALTYHAERRRAPVDGVRRDELVSAAAAGKASSAIGLELLDEASAFPSGIAIITEARAARFDRLAEYADDRIAEKLRFLQRN